MRANAQHKVAVLIPARDEERNIRECVERVLASKEVEVEVFVLDDESADRTQAIVLEMAAADPRVRLRYSTHLPRGWNGKQHACWELAQATTSPLLLFLDADVRLDPWALARCLGSQRTSGVALLSGFPRQMTETFLEWLLLPLIHFVLLGFLPMRGLQRGTRPAFAAGCGQFFLVDRAAYFACGGHAAIRETRHDGLRLPRLFREHGYRTDLVDLTTLASVRMYDSAGAVWRGLGKNATEGLAAPGRIVWFTLLLFAGQVLPVALVALYLCDLAKHSPLALGLSALLLTGLFASFLAAFLPRVIAAKKFRQPMKSALLHPVGVALLLVLQWYALTRQVIGKPVGWRARKYETTGGEEIA